MLVVDRDRHAKPGQRFRGSRFGNGVKNSDVGKHWIFHETQKVSGVRGSLDKPS
jgi:hypothetical protein